MNGVSKLLGFFWGGGGGGGDLGWLPYPFMAVTTIEDYPGRLLSAMSRVLLARESQSALEQCGVNAWAPTLSEGDDDQEGLQGAYEGICGGKTREDRRHKI